MGTKVKIVPVEAYNSVGIVEYYHGPIRCIYLVITAEINGINKDTILQMAFKAINDSAGPDGIVPTLLVYGALPRMTEYDTLLPTVLQRSAALKKAIVEIQKLQARRQIANALNTRNGPSTTDIYELPLNSDVLVWYKGNTGQSGSWDGLYKLVAVNGEDCVLALLCGNTTFRSTSIKPFYVGDIEVITDDPEPEPEPVTEPYGKAEGDAGMIPPAVPAVLPKCGRGCPRKNPDVTVFLQDNDLYKDSR
jgi:hypothetical protein